MCDSEDNRTSVCFVFVFSLLGLIRNSCTFELVVLFIMRLVVKVARRNKCELSEIREGRGEKGGEEGEGEEGAVVFFSSLEYDF